MNEQPKPKPSTAEGLSKIGKYIFFVLAVVAYLLGDTQTAILCMLAGILVRM